MKRYRVLLPVEIDGHIYQAGEITAELSLETAKLYSHALVACEEVDGGGNK
jgi:hypothetical protein